MTSQLTYLLKKLLIGREIAAVDKAICSISRGRSSGWVVGNQLRSLTYGRKKGTCQLPIVFIGCFPRSGSTLLRAILQSHPDVAAGQTEINIFQDIKTVSRKTKMNIIDAFEARGDELDFAEKNGNLVEIADYVLGRFMQREGAKLVLLKQPKHIFFLDDIFRYYPNSKFIHIIRDGRNATMSQRYFLVPEDQVEWPYEWCCRQWNVCINRGKTYRCDSRYMEVRYEDLLVDPITTASRIFDFLEVTYLPAERLMDFHRYYDASKQPQHPEVANPIDQANINKWIDRMTDQDREIFNRIAGRNNSRLGYLTD